MDWNEEVTWDSDFYFLHRFSTVLGSEMLSPSPLEAVECERTEGNKIRTFKLFAAARDREMGKFPLLFFLTYIYRPERKREVYTISEHRWISACCTQSRYEPRVWVSHWEKRSSHMNMQNVRVQICTQKKKLVLIAQPYRVEKWNEKREKFVNKWQRSLQ